MSDLKRVVRLGDGVVEPDKCKANGDGYMDVWFIPNTNFLVDYLPACVVGSHSEITLLELNDKPVPEDRPDSFIWRLLPTYVGEDPVCRPQWPPQLQQEPEYKVEEANSVLRVNGLPVSRIGDEVSNGGTFAQASNLLLVDNGKDEVEGGDS